MGGEFDLIGQYFSRVKAQQSADTGIIYGVADDCAIYAPAAQRQLAISKDLLVEGKHFFSDVSPYALGHKALAVNLSDLAAMGAKAKACLLGIALPKIDHAWIKAFSDGFYALSEREACPLIGGDTTGSDSGIIISVTVFGEITPPYLLRSQAKVGDVIWVSGYLGEAHLALNLLLAQRSGKVLSPEERALLQATQKALDYPEPRLALGQALSGIAHAMLDISDGLLQDLSHILKQSQVSATLYEEALPRSEALKKVSIAQQRDALLTGGDVYELCFTAPKHATPSLQALSKSLQIPLSPIGEVTTEQDERINVIGTQGERLQFSRYGFDHFMNV